MPIVSKNTINTLQEFWMTLSGWNDIKKFGKMFFFILRKPISHTIQVFKNIEAQDSFKFFVQSFVIFTIITSLFTAFRGNDILKSILQMLNQIFFLTLATMLYFLIFNSISKIKKSFTDFLVLYSLYMGFILPFFAIGTYLNWQLLLLGQDPTPRSVGPNPFKFILIILGDFVFTGFGIYYSYRIIRYFWNINFGQIFLGMGLVFALLTPVQMLWIKLQCKIGITPDFEFNNPAHRKATLSILGCTNVSCNKCLLIGEWKYTDNSIRQKRKQVFTRNWIENKQIISYINEGTIDKEMEYYKKYRMIFEENRLIQVKMDSTGITRTSSSSWFIADDGNYLFFDNTVYQIIDLKEDAVILSFENTNSDRSKFSDTIYIEPVRNEDRTILSSK